MVTVPYFKLLTVLFEIIIKRSNLLDTSKFECMYLMWQMNQCLKSK